MSDQSEDLRLAESLDMKSEVCLEGRPLPVSRLQGEFYAMCATELRRQHSRIAELESELMEQCRINGMGAERELAKIARIEADEALMRQALDVLDGSEPEYQSTRSMASYNAAITALRNRLESSNAS